MYAIAILVGFAALAGAATSHHKGWLALAAAAIILALFTAPVI